MTRKFPLVLLVFLVISLPSASSAMPAVLIQKLNEAIESAPADQLHTYYIYRSKAYFKMGDIQNGLSDIGLSLHFNPTPEAYLLRGEFYQSLHRYEEAINDYSAALKLNRHFLKAYLLRSQAYFANKEFNMAIIDASYVKMYDEDNGVANNIIEICYINMSPRQKIELEPNLEAIRRASRKGQTQGTRNHPRKKVKIVKTKQKKPACTPRRQSA